MATGDFCQLEDVKGYLPGNAATTANDALLARLITAASDWIRTYTNRDFLVQEYTQVLDGPGGPRLMLQQFPVVSIASLTVGGVPVDPSGVVIQDRIITRTDGGRFTKGLANVVVVYTAGLSQVPAAVRQACVELVAWRFREKDRVGLSSKSLQTGGEVEAYQTTDVPANVKTLLKNIRSVVPA